MSGPKHHPLPPPAKPSGRVPWRTPYGRGQNRNRRDGSLGSLEKRYARHLEERLERGEILRYDFEPEKFRLADKSFYTPDFRILLPDGVVEFHEVKGGIWEANARTKLKVAAEMHPFKFVAITARRVKDGGGWDVEEF